MFGESDVSVFTSSSDPWFQIMTIDDILGNDIDANVERTKNRALPRGIVQFDTNTCKGDCIDELLAAFKHRLVQSETSARRLEEMDALFEESPIFVPGSGYIKVSDRRAAENDLLNSQIHSLQQKLGPTAIPFWTSTSTSIPNTDMHRRTAPGSSSKGKNITEGIASGGEQEERDGDGREVGREE
ncbi:hypothetical protein EDD18DRAFT_1344367 [Armillaria luteobubalina]|uniref:Uncharacterized protein n=1 Tax=Armillaria luteobubalina TaxID=153913 RepID=A0AA39QP79_9AGAR|nr:hypothetical protein EDD18DRAFT_1344367 [Armillaria luteobubalina]